MARVLEATFAEAGRTVQGRVMMASRTTYGGRWKQGEKLEKQ